jgi:SAM-dependent methyltransferase
LSAPSTEGLRIADVLRLTVPWDAPVKVVALSAPDPDALRLQLVHAREEGAGYAVAPAPHDTLRPRGFRVVAHEPRVCAVFALSSLVEPKQGNAVDGLPYPPPEMVRLVAGISTPHRFYQRFVQGGAQVANRIIKLLARNECSFEHTGAVLDFGCGCGRVMRSWKDLDGPRLHGTDYNPFLVEWCRHNLSFAEFSVNGLEPGLDHADGQFDLVYSYSVFTHLPPEMQRPWLDELMRVTAPGGHLLLTFHGEQTLSDLEEADRDRFAGGELVVVSRHASDYGTNACAAYHPESWIRGEFTAGLEVLDHWPGDSSFKQDAYLMKRPGGQ